ncbi:MAG TPA: ATP-binding protein [Candidatus Sulfotelmatobacter sp.]|nr:ATP-binding protein [Candidatus Sulfotelmatobacter sp.]
MAGMRDFSIPKKLTWMNMLVSGTALLLAATALFAYDLYVFRTGIIRSLGIQAQIIGSNSISAVVFGDPAAAEKTLAALRAAPHVISAEIYTPDGRPFAGYQRDATKSFSLPPGIPAGQAEAYSFHKNEVGLVRAISFEGKPAASVYIRSDLGALRERIGNFALIVGAVFLMSLFAAVWMSSSARRSISDPIVRLAETAQTVLSEKNYSVRAPEYATRNEIGVLISSFNEMLAQIQERDAALEEARNRLEQQVQERTAQLNVANADLEAFSYSVSHDLRAPLRHIGAFSQILQEECGQSLDGESLHYLKRIQDGVASMSHLIEDLLKMGQIGRKEVVLVRTDLNLLVKDTLAELQEECPGRNIEWRIGELPTIECDSGLLKQVFANLLSNAVKYTRRREVAIIEVGQAVENGVPAIFIRDNGAGFDQQYAGKLFRVFQRLHRSEDFEGTGVGLSTVDRIVKKHGGQIWAHGELDKGATFYFALAPRAAGASSSS